MLTFEQIKELIELVARHQLSGVELDRAGFRLKIDGLRPVASPGVAAAAPDPQAYAVSQLQPAAAPVAAQAAAAPAGASAAAAGGGAQGAAAGAPAGAGAAAAASAADFVQRSPIVGTFYRSPAPELPPFAHVGMRIAAGATICIVEAMKVMNEITAERGGVLKEIFPKNAQAVEYDEPLFVIETDD